MNISRALILALLGSAAFALNAAAQKVYTPKPGSSERAELMDAIRVPAKKDLGRDVIFVVNTLRVAGDWAYARVTPQRPDGGKIDFSRTRYRQQVEDGDFDPQGETLLRRRNGQWKAVEWVFGMTDVPSVAWPDKYPLPPSLIN